MGEKLRKRWQERSATVWEPGEQVESVHPGWKSEHVWQSPIIVGPLLQVLAGWARVYVVTDRNVYVIRPSNWKAGVAKDVLVKRPRTEAKLTFERRRLRLDGADPVFIPLIGRKRAEAAVENVAGGSTAVHS